MRTPNPASKPVHPTKTRRFALAITLLGGLLMGAGESTAVAGYVNVFLTSGYNLLCNPLSATANKLSGVFSPTPPHGSVAFVWNVATQSFLPPATYDSSEGWLDPNFDPVDYDLPVGHGFVLYVPSAHTNTFVGDVLTGSLTNPVAGDHQWSLLGSKVPQSGMLSSNLAFPLLDGASVHFHRRASQSFSDAYNSYTNFGWFDPDGVEGAGGPNYVVGESFWVQNPGPPTNWVRNFILARPAPGSPTGPPVDRLQVHDGAVTLQWTDSGGRHDVQFSTDGDEWITLAQGVSGGIWSGPLPDPVQARFRLVSVESEGGGK